MGSAQLQGELLQGGNATLFRLLAPGLQIGHQLLVGHPLVQHKLTLLRDRELAHAFDHASRTWSWSVRSGPLRLSFNERPPGGEPPRSFNLEMQPKLMQGLMHLLDQALLQSQWREPFVQPAGPEPVADDDATRPRYLN